MLLLRKEGAAGQRMGMIDSHVHFWALGRPEHQWPDASLPAIHRDVMPANLRAAIGGMGVTQAVLVQAQPDARDTGWMLGIADADPLIAAVVGWADLAAEDAADRIAALAQNPKLRGLRPMLQGIEDTDWLMQAELAPAIDAMERHGLRFDALIQPRHLPMLHGFALRRPGLKIVIDHGAKPRPVADGFEPWGSDIAALAKLPNIWCKLSGLRTEQAAGASPDDLAPFIRHLHTLFGDRLMWGSDWPVLQLMGDAYAAWPALVRRVLALTEEQDARLFGGAAAEFYGIG